MAIIENEITKAGTLTGAVENLADNMIESAIGGFSPFNDYGKYFTGSRAIIKINDRLFGFAFAVSFNIKTSVESVNTIDDWTPYELAPNRITVEGTLGMFHIPGKGPGKKLVQPNLLSFLFHKYITISISDSTTGETIFETKKAFITERSQTIQSGEISTISLGWKAIGFADEIEGFWPKNYDGNSGGATGGSTGLIGAVGSVVDSALDLF